MTRSLKRIGIAVLLALPGIALACFAKPLILGNGAMLLGLLLAFSVPMLWLAAASTRRPDRD